MEGSFMSSKAKRKLTEFLFLLPTLLAFVLVDRKSVV